MFLLCQVILKSNSVWPGFFLKYAVGFSNELCHRGIQILVKSLKVSGREVVKPSEKNGVCYLSLRYTEQGFDQVPKNFVTNIQMLLLLWGKNCTGCDLNSYVVVETAELLINILQRS